MQRNLVGRQLRARPLMCMTGSYQSQNQIQSIVKGLELGEHQTQSVDIDPIHIRRGFIQHGNY